MKSDRVSRGLSYLTTNQYSEASTQFESLSTPESGIDKTQQANCCYYQAVSRLGALLVRLAKESKVESKTASINELFSKRNNNRDLLEKKLSTPNKHAMRESKEESLSSHQEERSSDADGIAKEIHSILLLFESAKKVMRAKQIPGIDYPIKNFIPHLLRLNQITTTHRAKYFAAELAKFNLLYSTKLAVTENLIKADERDESLISRWFSSDTAKKLRITINENKDDTLFLSEEQISELYKQLLAYQYDKKYHGVYEKMERQIFLRDYSSSDDELSKLWKKFKGNVTIDKVSLLKSIYDDHKLRDLSVIISELNDNQLLTDSLFPCLQAIAFPAEDYFKNLKTVEDTIAKSQIKNKNELIVKLFEYGLDKIPHASIPDYQFNRYISLVKKSCLTLSDGMDANKVYMYLDLLTLLIQSKGKKIPLDKVADLMRQVENLVGRKNFGELCQRVIKYKLSHTDFITVLNLAIQLSKESMNDLLQLIDNHHHDMDALRHQLHDIIARDYQMKFPERSLDDVTHDFLTKSQDVEFTIEAKEFAELKEKYLRIKAIGESLITLGNVGIESALNDCKALLRKNPADKEAQLTLLAIIRLQVKSQFGINPYNVQMINVLALLNQPKRIAQIKTGEGKSTLIAIMAAYHGIMGHKVDIVTTSHDLAIRDAKKFKDFYRGLGLKVSHNAKEEQGSDANCYNHDIVYGTVSDFEFAYLRKETGQSDGRGDRPYDVVIADEVDSMFIDMQRNEAILSRSTEATYKANVYHDIWNWISKTDKKDQNKENLQAMLKAKGVEVSLDLATTWLKSARTAQLYSEEKEYIVGYPENKPKDKNKKWRSEDRVIKIVNKAHTGEVQSESTRWQGGLHEILEAKHKLQVHTESLTSASISHIEFFNKYKTLVGLTGTLGSIACREELQQLYHVNTYDSPPYKPSRKKPVPHVIAKDEKLQNSSITDIVKSQVKAGRPILILCESIKDSKDLYDRLSKEIKSIEIYNGVQQESSEAILGLAGNPGAVTIATNVAGRGTDIVVTPEAEANGGLHVLVTFPAINRRVEQQAFGRTGRQGRQGTFQYVLREDQLSSEENAANSVDEKIQLMRKVREEREKAVSQMNLFNYNLMHKLFILQSVFFSLPERVKLNTLNQWATFKTSAHKYTVQYLREELEDVGEDEVFQDVLDEFADFWQDTIAASSQRFKTPQDYIKSRLKEAFPDEHTKTLLVQALVLLDDPKFDFSSGISDLCIEMKASELDAEKERVEGASGLMQFYHSRAAIPPSLNSGVEPREFKRMAL